MRSYANPQRGALMAALLSGAAWTALADAQTAESQTPPVASTTPQSNTTTLHEPTVTPQKRQQSLNDVGLTALGSEGLAERQSNNSAVTTTQTTINLEHNSTSGAGQYYSADAGTEDWPLIGQSTAQQHFSDLSQINVSTVKDLGLAWSLDLGGEHTLAAPPIEAEGTLYFPGSAGTAYAVGAKTGELKWRYDAEIWKARPQGMGIIFRTNRGVAYDNGKVFLGALDGRLIALDAKTGKKLWETMTLDPDSMMNVTGAPRVFNGKVVIGQSGGDFGERGYLSAYDQQTGKLVWRFYTVPGDPEHDRQDANAEALAMAAKTWSPNFWKKTGGGGTVWEGVTFDKELNRLYIGTGNSGPYDPQERSPGGGDNLFLASIVAVDADTGKYIWHYQVNPREAWDYKAAANIVLSDLTIDGKKRKVILQAPTNGFFYVIDRETGKLISAEKYAKANWAKRIDIKTGRPVEVANVRYEKKPFTMWPSAYGAHNWQPMSFNPQTGLVYIPTMQLATVYGKTDNPIFGGGTYMKMVKVDKDDGNGALVAWDPIAQKARWRVPIKGMWNGGTITTAGDLVFQGDNNGLFHAYNAKTGDELWTFDAKLGIVAAPITYSIGGEQYVSLLVGFGGSTNFLGGINKSGWKYNVQPRRLLTFKLGATSALPKTAPRDFSVQSTYTKGEVIDEAAARAGSALYNAQRCVICHAVGLESLGSPAPDLRESGIATNKGAFTQLLRSGVLLPNGMPKFDHLSDKEITELYMYIRAGAREAAGGPKAPPPAGQGTH